jgi:CheY-like chemotaxis protein/nitrogen-specific signal transduction histidine kinase
MILCFLNGEGWIWANRTFLDTMGYFDIRDFKRENESIRDIFLNESEEIFTESEKNWLDYIKKYKHNGHSVSISDKEGNLLMINVTCTDYPRNNKIYILTLENVTQLHQAEFKAKEVEKLKTKFLANVGHEFRTPMNGILGFVELMRQTDLDSKQLEYVDMISQSSKNLMNNIEALLNLSQLQGGRMELNRDTFNIVPIMEKLAYDFYKQGQSKGIKVLSFIDPKIPQELEGDSEKIVQVMNAIISNAIKFISRGGRVIVEVKLLKRLPNGDCSISFGVKDNGEGISQEQIALINEPFTAGNHADERLGVGLSLSHGFVTLMGSELRVKSEENYGTYVNFVLDFNNVKGQNYKMMPKKTVKILLLDQSKVDEANFLALYLRSFAIDVLKSNVLDEKVYDGIDALYVVANQDESSWMLELGTYHKKAAVHMLLDEDEVLKTRLTHIIDYIIRRPLLPSKIAQHLSDVHSYNIKVQKPLEKTPQLTKEVKVLVVEDNLINQRLIQILLQQYNLSVSISSNGLEAVEMSAKNKYDLIFMDIDMPQMNGIVATKKIKARFVSEQDRMPIIALTAMAMEGDKEMLLSEGLDDYLSKPITRDKIEYILNKYIKIKA